MFENMHTAAPTRATAVGGSDAAGHSFRGASPATLAVFLAADTAQDMQLNAGDIVAVSSKASLR